MMTFAITRSFAITLAKRLCLPMSSSSKSRVCAAQADTQILPPYFLFSFSRAFLQSAAESVRT